jgi:hypothetical protein
MDPPALPYCAEFHIRLVPMLLHEDMRSQRVAILRNGSTLPVPSNT